jgi:uncharacterized damage-inducible protein DinB
MTWIAPKVDRTPTPKVADERTMLEGWLEHHRQTLVMKCAGLTEEQLKAATVEPSNLTLLGLVRHMAEVERWWFRRNASGAGLSDIYCSQESPDGDFDDIAGADAEADFATLEREVAAARSAIAGRSLDDTFERRHRDGTTATFNVRWVYVHMIEEYARHNGHADLIRERIDGVTGD